MAESLELRRPADIDAEAQFRRIFDTSPIPTWEQDYSEVLILLERHRAAGVDDIIKHLAANPGALNPLIAAVRVENANQAAIDTYEYDPAEHGGRISLSSHGSRLSFIEQVAAVWNAQSAMHYEYTRDPDHPGPSHCSLHWSAGSTETGPDFSHVVISIADVAGRHALAQQLQRRADQLHLLHEVNRDISSQLDIDVLLETIAAGIHRLLDADWVELLLLDEALETVTARVAIGVGGPGPDSREVHDGIAGWVLRTGSPTLSPAVQADPRIKGKALASAVATDAGSLAIAPLTIAGRSRGTLAAGNVGSRKVFAQSDLEILALMAAHASFAVQNAVSVKLIESQAVERDRLIASVAHELRTPLAAASGFAEELEDRWDTFSQAERRALVSLIAQESADANTIVEDLLVSARAELGQLPLLHQPLDLAAQVASVVDSIGDVAATIEIVGQSPVVVGDPIRVRQIIRNLLTNAVRYGGDAVRVELAGDESTGRVLVTDNGPGVGAELEDTLFTAFARGSSSSPTTSVGLGLSISRQLAQLMNGSLAYRRRGDLTVFELVLPHE